MNAFTRCLALVAMLFASASLSAQEKKSEKPLDIKGELTDQDPNDRIRPESHHKVHEFKMQSGKTYRIDLNSDQIDTLLRIEDADGKQLALDDDGGGGLNSRLIFKAPADGTYKLIVTTYPPKQKGRYHLSVLEPSRTDLMKDEIRTIAFAPPEKQAKFKEEFLTYLEGRGGKINFDDARLSMQLGFGFERSKGAKGVADFYTKLSKAISASDDAKVKEIGKLFDGCARRMRLPGNPIDVKGTTLEGKAIDWKTYRGKVVLVDFWATWCGPCIGELPNIKKQYAAYKDKGFDVVGISIDQDGDALEQFVARHKLPWATIFEKDSKRQPLAEQYGVMAIPLAILVDREGNVVSMNARGAELGRLLEKHLGAPGGDNEKKEK